MVMSIAVQTNDNVTEKQAAAERERKQFVKMTQTPIAKLVISLGIPTMLSMMVTSLYNLADTMFLSMLGDDDITAAVSNLLALMSIIQAIGFTFGMGSGAIVSRLLGKRDRAGADRVASSSFFVSAACGVIILIFGYLFMNPLLRLLGSGEQPVLGYSQQYVRWILIAAPFMCMSFVMNNILRAEGKAALSMIGLVAGAVVNVGLDPLLIFTADLGVTGAALATCVSQFISFVILLVMFLTRKTIVRLRIRSVSKKFKTYSEVIATGFPSFCRQMLASLCSVFLNNAALLHGGAAAQASFGVVQKVFMLAFSISLGIGQGYQPVLGYNYSSKRFDRVKKSYLFTLTFSTALMTIFSIVCAIFSSQIMRMFSLSDRATEIGTLTLRLQCICMPLLPVNFMASVTYQVVGNKVFAALLAISRQGLFYIPAVLILPNLMGLVGVQSCQAVADAFAFLYAVPFTLMFFKQLKKAKLQAEAEGNTIDDTPVQVEQVWDE